MNFLIFNSCSLGVAIQYGVYIKNKSEVRTHILMDIDTLIAKYLNGESTPEEIERINRWRQSSPENEQVFHRSEETWHLACHNKPFPLPSKSKTWKDIRQHIAVRYSLSTLVRVAGIAASIALIAGLALAYTFISREGTPVQPQQITLFVPGGVSSRMVLPDSTVVWLNSSSSISYPSCFAGNTRTIELTGEAFFEVTKDETRPFIINSGNLQVKVLGTSFNFKHYREDTHAVLAVETGTVTLSAGTSGTATTLNAGNYVTVDNQTLHTRVYDTPLISASRTSHPPSNAPKMTEGAIPASQFSSWRDYRMVFRDEPFNNVLNELSRRYNAEFEIKGDEIRDYTYTATFNDMSLDDVLKLLKLSSPIDYTIKSLTSNSMNAYGKRKVTIFRK